MRKRLTKRARYLTHTILRLPRFAPHTPLSTSPNFLRLLARYTELALTFLISGLFHQTIEVAQGLSWDESGATRFFVTMAGAVVVEDAVQGAWRWGEGSEGGKDDGRWWKKPVGYV